MEIWQYTLQFIAAAVGTCGFAFVFNTPRREIPFCAINGGIIWVVYLILLELGSGTTIACMGATFAITIVARVFSAIRKNPATVFMITAIFPLVPGAGIYYTAYYLIMNDFAMAGQKGMETFAVVGGIVLGIVFGFFVPHKIFNRLAAISNKKEDKRYVKMP